MQYPTLAATQNNKMSDRQPLTACSNFGESSIPDYGQRLEYSAPKCRDIVFAVAYYIHIFIVVGVAAYLWMIQYPLIQSDEDDWHSQISLTGIFVGIVACLFAGIVFGLFWLAIMKKFASCIIKAMLFFNIAIWCIVAIVGVLFWQLILIILGVIFAALYALYTWCVWSRIPFSSVLLAVSSTITSAYGGTIFVSLCVIFFDIMWLFIWGACSSAYYVAVEEPHNAVIFFLLVSLYWGFQVNQNISHTTTCGVTATWYFSADIMDSPTVPAFKRTMTTSFGSVCLGSLIVAILQAIRAMVRAAMQNSDNECLMCIVMCLLQCIENMIEYFNKYAYAQCAIYGVSFVTAAKRTWQLFSSRGMEAIINDDLTGLAIFAGALIGAVLCGGLGFVIGFVFYLDVAGGEAVMLAVYGFVVGLVVTSTILYVVHSSIICLFVCYAEDPATLSQNRPHVYADIIATNPDFENVYANFGEDSINSVSQQQRPQPYTYNAQQQPPQYTGQQPPPYAQQRGGYNQQQQPPPYAPQSGQNQGRYNKGNVYDL